jgi:hypothetical protein
VHNVFFDNPGFPDDSNEYNKLLHNINGGVILQKKKFPAPPIHAVNPVFNWEYSNELHGDKLWTNLDISHLSPEHAAALLNVIKKHWCVFDKHSTFMPVRNYECIIDTGTAAPIAIKKIPYGPREILIMQRCIAALAKVGQIRQIHDSQWLFKTLLAWKPHQEHVCNINDFVWRFCVNYILLNQIMQQITCPIPQCDAAVEGAFGGSWIWLYDVPMGYCQIHAFERNGGEISFPRAGCYKMDIQCHAFWTDK